MSAEKALRDARRPSRHLTFDDAVKIVRMYDEGMLQSRIAAHFDVNQGRVSEIVTGLTYHNARAVARGGLH
jgi:hypothetical protein